MMIRDMEFLFGASVALNIAFLLFFGLILLGFYMNQKGE